MKTRTYQFLIAIYGAAWFGAGFLYCYTMPTEETETLVINDGYKRVTTKDFGKTTCTETIATKRKVCEPL